MNSQEFVDQINIALTKYKIPEGQSFLQEILIPEKKTKKFIKNQDLLDELFCNFNLRKMGGFLLTFNKSVTETKEYRFFASDDPFKIGIDKKTEEIIMFDEEWDRIHCKLAKNFEQYLTIELLIYEYNLPGYINDKNYTKTDRNNLLTKISKIVERDYLQYFTNCFGN